MDFVHFCRVVDVENQVHRLLYHTVEMGSKLFFQRWLQQKVICQIHKRNLFGDLNAHYIPAPVITHGLDVQLGLETGPGLRQKTGGLLDACLGVVEVPEAVVELQLELVKKWLMRLSHFKVIIRDSKS